MGLRSRFSRQRPLFRRLRRWIADPVAREHAEHALDRALAALQPRLDALEEQVGVLEAKIGVAGEHPLGPQVESLRETQSILIREKEHIGDHLTALQKDFDAIAGTDGVVAKLSSLVTDLQHVQTELAATLAQHDRQQSLREEEDR